MKRAPLLLAFTAFAIGCTKVPFKDFDVGAKTYDPNPFPLNPLWGKQIEQSVLPTPKDSCPLESDSDNPNDWTQNPQYPNCTSWQVTFNGGTFCGPHVNFMAVTYEGKVRWDGNNRWPIAEDSDYMLNVTRDEDSALYTEPDQQVHIEFDSDETVDNWDDTNTWWDDFHHHYADNGDAAHVIDGRPVIVTGLLNLDTLHRGKPELHPVYVLFIRTPNDVGKTSWAFFVRNWGNQGYCGDDQQNLYTARQQLKVRVPDVLGLETYNIWEGAQNDDQLDPMNVTVQPSGDGQLLTFTLLQPEKQSWFVGDLTFATRPPAATGGQPSPGGGRHDRSDAAEDARKDPNRDLAAEIGQLPPGTQQELLTRLESLFPRRKPVKVTPTVRAEPVPPERAARAAAKVTPGANVVRPKPDAAGRTRRDKRIEAIRKFLAEAAGDGRPTRRSARRAP